MTEDVFEDLVNLYLDKEITSAQLDILQKELERNPRRRRVFQSYCRLHQATHFAALSQCPIIPTQGKSMAPRSTLLGYFSGKPAWAGAFIIIAFTTSLVLYLNSPVAAPVGEEAISGLENQLDRFHAKVEIPSPDAEAIAGSVAKLDWFQSEVETPSLDAFRTFQAQGKPLQNWDYTQGLRPLRATPDYLPSHRTEDFPFSSGYSGFLAEQEPASGFDYGYSNYEFKR